jgi:hypothetical protein
MLIPYVFEDIPKQPLQEAGESSNTGWKNHGMPASGTTSTVAPHVMSLLILPQPQKPRMAEVVVRVHSTNSNCPVNSGFSHLPAFIFQP